MNEIFITATHPASVDSSKRTRSIRDFYATPFRVVRGLLKKEQFSGSLLEPACGTGHIVTEMKRHGYGMTCFDKYDYSFEGSFMQDFLKWDIPVDCIITNPPYSLSNQFMIHATNLALHKVAFLMPLTYLHGLKRTQILQQTKLSRVWVLIRNPGFQDPQTLKVSRKISYAWYVWDKQEQKTGVRLGWIK